tara:strand:- start:158 stop:322 length:165 start_codon:yes stop_codon:yes gene_type:complete
VDNLLEILWEFGDKKLSKWTSPEDMVTILIAGLGSVKKIAAQERKATISRLKIK